MNAEKRNMAVYFIADGNASQSLMTIANLEFIVILFQLDDIIFYQ
jgi:hypothetical protein